MLKLVIFFIISLIAFVIIFSKIQVSIDFERTKTKRLFKIFIFISFLAFRFKIRVFNRRLNNIFNNLIEKGSRTLRSNWVEMPIRVFSSWRKTKNNNPITADILRLTKKRVTIRKISAEILFGSGDAARTGITIGRMWTVMGIGLSTLENNFKVLQRRIVINPDFNQKILNIYLSCIFEVKTVYIIIGSIYLLFKYKFKQKNSLGGDIIGGTSN